MALGLPPVAVHRKYLNAPDLLIPPRVINRRKGLPHVRTLFKLINSANGAMSATSLTVKLMSSRLINRASGDTSDTVLWEKPNLVRLINRTSGDTSDTRFVFKP